MSVILSLSSIPAVQLAQRWYIFHLLCHLKQFKCGNCSFKDWGKLTFFFTFKPFGLPWVLSLYFPSLQPQDILCVTWSHISFPGCSTAKTCVAQFATWDNSLKQPFFYFPAVVFFHCFEDSFFYFLFWGIKKAEATTNASFARLESVLSGQSFRCNINVSEQTPAETVSKVINTS